MWARIDPPRTRRCRARAVTLNQATNVAVVARSGLLIAAVLVSAPAWALDPSKSLNECTVDVWRVREGLPSSWVRALAQGPDGYLWIAALGGVGRYDGSRIDRVTATETGSGRVVDPVDLLAAADGTLWVVPALGPPVCRRDGMFQDCLPAGALPADVRVKAISQDREGTVWLVTADGFFRWRAGLLEPLALGSAVAANRVSSVHRDSRGRLWVGAGTGLYREQAGKLVLQQGPAGPLNTPIASLFESPRGHLWIVSARELVRIDGEEVQLFGRGEGLPVARFTQVIEDRDGTVWIASHEGLMRFRPDTLPPRQRFVTFTEADGLPDETLATVFEDREGSLWVGTRAGGLAQFTDRTVNTHAGPSTLRHRRVFSLCQGVDDVMWFGTHDGVLRQRGTEERWFTKTDGLPSDRIFSVLPEADGSVWVGTEHGLVRIGDAGVERVMDENLPIFALDRDASGTLWVGSDARVFTLAAGARHFDILLPEPGFELGHLRAIARDDGGTVWLAATSGLAKLEGRQLVRAAEADGIDLGPVRSIHRDRDGDLWLGTAGSGLVRRSRGHFTAIDQRSGLDVPETYQVITDDLGFLWIGTSRGILRFDRQQLRQSGGSGAPQVTAARFEISDERRDVSATGTRQPGAWKSRDGRIWFAAEQGVLTLDPAHLRLDPVPPPVVIESALVDGRPVVPGHPAIFGPGRGNLEFHFAAVTLIERHKVRHRYQLEGFDPGWIEAGTRQVAYYTNIAPGSYRFRVQASNADGAWNNQGDAVAFRLRPAFHQTGWFYALAALAVLALAWLLHRVRLLRLRREYLAVFAERGRVARELHDRLLQEMSATAMHLYAVRTQIPAAAQELAPKIEAIEKMVSGSVEETRRYVWDLREASDGPADLGRALEALAQRSAGGRPESCVVTVQGAPVRLSLDVHDQLLRIAHEALRNALKHAQASRIDVQLAYHNDGITLTIRDDGRGFRPERVDGRDQGHFGLLGMRERAARIGAALELTSRSGEGTTVEVVLPAGAGVNQ
jgi:signal transduction histidine kinase/ligand-binding sensor domain-containing protein